MFASEVPAIERDLLRARLGFLRSAPAVPGSEWQGIETGADRGFGEVVLVRDEAGFGNVLIPVGPTPPPFRCWSRRGIEAKLQPMEYRRSRRYFIRVRCTVRGVDEAFASMASDIVRDLAVPGMPVGDVVRATLDRHASIFERAHEGMDREELIGLFGELLTLESLAAHQAGAIRNWTGPSLGRHDFVFAQDAIEVKSRLASSPAIVRIHGAGQLDSPAEVQLWLVTWELVSGGSSSLSAAELIERVLALGVDRALLGELLAAVGTSVDAEQLRSERFTPRDPQVFVVKTGFPRVTPHHPIEGGIPAGIERLEYDLRLTALDRWRVAGPEWRREVARIASTA